ncbi:unnamed protein product, partial [Rotaria magnacalcarata]
MCAESQKATTPTTVMSASDVQVNLETFYLICLDAAVNVTDENIESQKLLRASINYLEIFDNDEKCENHIQSLSVHDRVVLVVSGRFGQFIVPRIHSLRQLSAVNGVFVKLKDLIDQIQFDQKKRNTNQTNEELPFHIFNSTNAHERSSTGMNGQFVHSQVLIDCLLGMQSTTTLKNELVAICEKAYKGNSAVLGTLREFKQSYSFDRAIWWYTRDSFLYRIMNKALREQNIDLLFLLRFIISDMKQQLKKYQCSSRLKLYRGQLMSMDELEMLNNSRGQLISINSFLSTSVKREVAYNFLMNSIHADDTARVLFEIVVDPKVGDIKSFANVKLLSYFPQEEEVLIMLGSIFKLGLEWYSKSLKTKKKKSVTNNPEIGKSYVNISRIHRKKDNLDLAMESLKKALRIFERVYDDEHLVVADCLNSMGYIYMTQKNPERAMDCFQKALTIDEKHFTACHARLGILHNSLADAHRGLQEYEKSLEHANTALKIFGKSLPTRHHHVGWSFEIMGNVYEEKKEFVEALKHFRQAESNYCSTLPTNH